MIIRATTTRDLRKNFKKIADDVSDYNSWQETNYLLSTEANRHALQKGMSTKHSEKILTPEEWDKLSQDND